MPVEIREEQPSDIPVIREVNRRAFGQDQEGNIVDALRANQAVLLSLVATLKGQVVGHIMYSPLVIGGEVEGAALGPMAVLPFVIVLGHAHFYPRFGFGPARAHSITCEWDVPDDVFMLLALDQAKTKGMSGLAKYRHEFSIGF